MPKKMTAKRLAEMLWTIGVETNPYEGTAIPPWILGEPKRKGWFVATAKVLLSRLEITEKPEGEG